MQYEDSIAAADLDKRDLDRLLMEGAGGIYLNEASARLLIRHDFWLGQRDFLEYVVVYGDPPEAAGIDWPAALKALERGELRCDSEQRSILKIAGSISTFYLVSLREVVENIDRENIRHIAEAIMYADGFLGSTANPIP